MDEQSNETKDIIREFCRSHGAPSAGWLGRLSTNGQRECIRRWIIRSRSPEIYSQTHAVVEQLYEERANKDEFFFDALSGEEVLERVERARRRARERLDEEIRYGAISIDEIHSPQPWVAYNRYHDISDQEWQLMVEGEQTRRNPRYALLATLLVVATAMAFRELYVAMWCAVIGGLLTTFLVREPYHRDGL
ncbi:MAG TPA: hypothetical protein VN943_03925 [Candidatus Acidoferrum sp.]|nr:hypothetical protein [Candidatus Acidoferrum sp.]